MIYSTHEGEAQGHALVFNKPESEVYITDLYQNATDEIHSSKWQPYKIKSNVKWPIRAAVLHNNFISLVMSKKNRGNYSGADSSID